MSRKCVLECNIRRTLVFLTDLAYKSQFILPPLMYILLSILGLDIQVQFRFRDPTEYDTISQDSELGDELSVAEEVFE